MQVTRLQCFFCFFSNTPPFGLCYIIYIVYGIRFSIKSYRDQTSVGSRSLGIEILDEDGEPLVGVAVRTLINHYGVRATTAAGDNGRHRLRSKAPLHNHRRLRPPTLHPFSAGAI